VLRIDHAVYAVPDLEEAAARLREDHGLDSVPGGVHPRWGTGNRIVPLGTDYVELMAVVDRGIAADTDLGRKVLEITDRGSGWFALCLADDDLHATAERLGLSVEAGSRTRPDDRVVSWRGAGIEDPRRTPDLPFFIAWDGPAAFHPGATPIDHASGATGIAWVEVVGDANAFERWTHHADLPLRFGSEGPPGVRAVALQTPLGELILR
jgi:Glyoxalase-like domain